MSSVSRYARPGDNVAPNATVSLVAGAIAAGSALANINDRRPAKACKLSGTSGTFRFTFGTAQVLVGIGIANHNLAGAGSVVLTSGSGLNVPITIPANTPDGQCTNVPVDFSSELLAQRTSTTFDLAVTGNALGNVAIGEVVLLTAWRDLRWVWGLKFHPGRLIVSPGTTWGGSDLRYNKRIRRRRVTGMVDLQSEEAALRVLEEQAVGELHPWCLWPDKAVADFWLVQFDPGSFSWTPQNIGQTDVPIEAVEVSSGPPLFA